MKYFGRFISIAIVAIVCLQLILPAYDPNFAWFLFWTLPAVIFLAVIRMFVWIAVRSESKQRSDSPSHDLDIAT